MKYNKLVRDKIPKIIRGDHRECDIEVLEDKVFAKALKEKLIEEAKEFKDAVNNEDIIEELADIYEVIEAFLIHEKIDKRQIDQRRIKKNIRKGAFEDKIKLIEVK